MPWSHKNNGVSHTTTRLPDPEIAKAYLVDPSYENHKRWFEACCDAGITGGMINVDTLEGARVVLGLAILERWE